MTGKVLDPEGKPAAAATVYLIQQNPTTGDAVFLAVVSAGLRRS